MANNCLVTKLKSVVDNSDLKKIGEVRIGLGAYDNGYETISVSMSSWDEDTQTVLDSNIEFKVIKGDIVFKNIVDDGEIGTSKTGSGIECRLYSPTQYIDDELVSITKIYNIVTFGITAGIKCNLDDLMFCSHLTLIGDRLGYLNTPHAYGDLSKILYSCKSKIKTIRLLGSQVTGTINDLYDCLALEEVALPSRVTNTGDWYNLILAQRNAGRVSGKIIGRGQFWGKFCNIETVDMWTDTAANNYIEWTSNKAYLYNKNNSNVKKVLCVGYTQSEIDTNTAAGGIWEGCTVTKCD